MFLTKKHAVLTLALVIALPLTSLLSSCSESAVNTEENTQSVNTEHRWSKEHKKHPEWPMEIREEVYGDADTFSTPRLMFWGEYKNSEVRTLWSARLDGSDRRRTIPERFFTQVQPVTLHPISRSPNNRYIAISAYKNDKPTLQLYDTKEQKLITMSSGGGYPWFNWTSDSENVIFYINGKHFNYHLPTTTLAKRPQIHHSSAAFLLPGDKEFLAMKHDGFWIHKFDGELVRKVDFGFPKKWEIKSPKISPDGKYIGFVTHFRPKAHFNWVNIDNPANKGEQEGISGSRLFSTQDNVLLQYRYKRTGEVTPRGFPLSNRVVRKTNLITGEQSDPLVKEEQIWGLNTLHPIALFNANIKENY